MTTARDVIESFAVKPEESDEEILKLLHDRGIGGCGRKWDGKEFQLTPTHAVLYLNSKGVTYAKIRYTHLQLLKEYRKQMKGEIEVKNELEMKVTFVDPEGRELYVGEQADGRYAIFTQKDKHAPRRLQSKYYNPAEGYETYEQANKDLQSYVSSKRASEPSYARWEVYVNGRHVTFDEYYAMCRREIAAPGSMPPDAPVKLANIEYRIAVSVQGAYENILEVGRCLNEAKDAGLVPHGEWEAWVRKNTGMSERNAQRLMQAARSVASGSMMERLPISKITAILALPESEREAAAQKAVDENQTVKQLRKEIAEANRKRETAETLRDTAQEALSTAQAEFENKLSDMRSRMEAAEEEHMEQLDAAREIVGAEYQDQIDALQRELDGLRSGNVLSASAEQRIRELEDEIESVNAYAEEQARLRSNAQETLLNMQASMGTPDHGRMDPMAIVPDIQNLIGTWAILPHMGEEIGRLSDRERETLKASLRLLAKFSVDVQEALMKIYYVEVQ